MTQLISVTVFSFPQRGIYNENCFDVDVIKHLPITQMVIRQVSEWGYKYIEQPPHPRINPFYKTP